MNHSLDNDMLNAVDHMDLGLPFWGGRPLIRYP
jgi:hypothetical protein